MMSVKDSACSQVALRVRGDTGQSKGGAQKSVDRVHSLWCSDRTMNRMVRPAGFEPALAAWKAAVLTRLDYGRCGWDGSLLSFVLRLLLKWVYQDGQWKARVILKQNALSWMVSGRVNHVE